MIISRTSQIHSKKYAWPRPTVAHGLMKISTCMFISTFFVVTKAIKRPLTHLLEW